MKPIRTIDHIPHFLVFSGKSLESESCRYKEQERKNLSHKILLLLFFSVTSGAVVKTPKSVLIPSVLKALCNNTKIVTLINKYAQGASYDLVEEIEIEYAPVRSYQ